MSEEALAPSDGAETTSVVDTSQQPDSGAQQQQQPSNESAKPVSAREAIDRAFDKTDLFSEEKPQKPGADNRDPKTGQFTEKAKDGKAAKPAAEAKPADAQKPGDQQPPTATVQPAKPAPSRLSKEAQAVWTQVPEVARNEIERAFTELQSGIEKYKSAYEPIRQFDDMARQSGTTLDQALKSYVGIEQLLRKDLLAGMREVCKNVGVDPAKVGAALAGQPGQQPAQGGDSIEVTQLKQQLENATREIEGLKQQFTGFSQSAEDRAIRAEVDEFKKGKAYFEELAPTMQQLLAGTHPQYAAKDLASAYDMAVRLNPEIAARIEAEKAATATPGAQPAQAQPQTKPAPGAQPAAKAKLSITGSPSSGSDPAQRKPAGSTRDALANAFQSVGL